MNDLSKMSDHELEEIYKSVSDIAYNYCRLAYQYFREIETRKIARGGDYYDEIYSTDDISRTAGNASA